METIIEILIDNSGSMGFMKGVKEWEGKCLIEGVTRNSIIKKILVEEIIPTLDYVTSIIIRSFRTNSRQVDGKTVEQTITPILYQGNFEKHDIIKIIEAIEDPPSGGTPITAAIDKAISDLNAFPQSDRKIILLTDGEENGGGDFKSAAKRALNLNGIPCKIFIVGLSLDEKSENEVKEIATGGFINIKSKSFPNEKIRNLLIPLESVVLKNSIQNLKQNAIENPVQSSNDKKIEIITEKLDSIVIESQTNALKRLNELEANIQNQIRFSQEILTELVSLKDMFRLNPNWQKGLTSTTLTIDTEYSEELRKKSEEFVYDKLVERYGEINVKWLNQNGESRINHDFEVLNENGENSLIIECKGTAYEKMTFYLTDDEWHYFLDNITKYQIYRVFNVENVMTFICIENLHKSIMDGKVVPYLSAPEVLKENRVFLTIRNMN